MGIEKLDQALCNGCGICFACCPRDVFRMNKETNKALIAYPADCVACWACADFCPVGCIEVSKDRVMELPFPY